MIQGINQFNLTSQDFVMSQLDTTQMPNDLINIPQFSQLNNLVIKNFKSFKQQTFTGPFLGFTSIIGPNGSGKSNILDALMFCLCGQNLKHNFFDLRQYINREKSQSYKDMSKKKKVCSVTANFLLQNNKRLSLKRQLDPEGNQSFYVNNEEVMKKIYQNFLYKQGINPHIPNYAITQGQIDKLLLKQPLELTRYIENLSGSFLFKKQYDTVKQEINQLRKSIINMTQRITKLKNDKKNAKNLNQASKQCKQLEKQYDQTVNKLFLAKTYLKDMDLQEFEKQIKKKKNQEKQKIEQINKRKLRIQEELKQKQQLNKQINGLEKSILDLNNKLKTLNRPDLIIKTKQLETHEKQAQYLQRELQNISEKQKKLHQSLPKIHSSQIIEEYLKLFSQWESKNRQITVQLQNKKTFYFSLQSQRQFQQSLLQSQQQKQKNNTTQSQKRKQDIQSIKQQIVQINNLIQKLNKQIKQKEQFLKQNEKILREKKQQFEKIQNQVQNLQQLLTQNVESEKDKQIVRRLCIIDGFKGIMEQKIRPSNQKYLVAFSVLTSSISKYLLCTAQSSSKQISDKLKDMNVIKTLIILNNVKKSHSQNSTKQAVGKSAIQSLDIIDFDKNVEGISFFLEQFCKGKVICDDLQTAFQIRNKKIGGLKQIITLDGEIIRTDGTIIACGNAQNVKRSYKLGSNKKSIETQLQKVLKVREQLKLKIDKLEKQCKSQQQIKRNEEIIKFQKKKQQLHSKIQFLSSIKPKESKSSKIIQRDIQILVEKTSKVEKQIEEIEKNMSKDKQFTSFMKKHNISNLQSFRSASNLQVLENQTKKRNEILRQIDELNDKVIVLKDKMHNKNARISFIKDDLNIGKNSEDKKTLQKKIQENQKRIKQIRDKISKLAVYRETDIQLRSEVVQMQTKYKLLKQKLRDFIEDLKIQLGATIDTPRTKADYKTLQQYIADGSIDEISRKKIQKAVRDLETQRKVSEDKLEKFNSMNLMQKNHDKQEAHIIQELKKLNEEVTNNLKRRSELQQQLQKLKNQRKVVFMNFFQKVKSTLKLCYQVLTQIQPGVSGKADLFLENSQLPFDHGIYFTPTPANKRFIYDLEQLSGGQKSIASLSLQYALAISSNSPFLILDESDAYLDVNNSAKLLKLLQQSFKQKKLQIILITHKFTIFNRCESLVGVTRPKQQFSKVFSCKVK